VIVTHLVDLLTIGVLTDFSGLRSSSESLTNISFAYYSADKSKNGWSKGHLSASSSGGENMFISWF
jgi:hypothetical protein